MNKVDDEEQLQYIRERVDAHAFHNARADMPYLLDLVTQLRQQRDEARAEFDSLGPLVERLKKTTIRLNAENKHLLQSRNEQLARANKLRQRDETVRSEREDRLRFEVADLRQQLAAHAAEANAAYQELEAEAAGLREQLVDHDSEASSVCQQWDIECEELKAEAAGLRERLATAEAVAALVPEADLLQRVAGYALCTAAARHQPIAPGVQEDADHYTLIMLADAIRAWRGDGDGSEEGETDE